MAHRGHKAHPQRSLPQPLIGQLECHQDVAARVSPTLNSFLFECWTPYEDASRWRWCDDRWLGVRPSPHSFSSGQCAVMLKHDLKAEKSSIHVPRNMSPAFSSSIKNQTLYKLRHCTWKRWTPMTQMSSAFCHCSLDPLKYVLLWSLNSAHHPS